MIDREVLQTVSAEFVAHFYLRDCEFTPVGLILRVKSEPDEARNLPDDLPNEVITPTDRTTLPAKR